MTRYLKKELATNIPKLVRLKARKGAYDEKKFGTDELTGKKEYLYVFADEKGEMTHYAKEYEEEVLSVFKPEDLLQVVRKEKDGKDGKRITFLAWTTHEGAEARSAAEPQLRTNTGLHAQEKELERQKQEEDNKWRRIDLSKIIFGYMNTEMAKGKSPSEAAATAKEAYQKQEETIDAILESIRLSSL